MSRIARSFAAARQSARVLAVNPQLLIFPLLSFASLLGLVALTFGGVAAAAGVHHPLSLDGMDKIIDALVPTVRTAGGGEEDKISAMGYGVILLLYFGVHFCGMFFNTAVTACALYYMQTGKRPTVGFGLGVAFQRGFVIAQWALLAATIGMVQNAIEERAGAAGRLVASLIGFAFAVASWFVLPVIILDGLGPVGALKKSAALVKARWGEQVMGGVAFSLIGVWIFIAGFAGLFAVGTFHAALGAGTGVVVAVIVGGELLAMLALSVVQKVYVAAVYQFATTGTAPSGFDADLAGAFQPRKK